MLNLKHRKLVSSCIIFSDVDFALYVNDFIDNKPMKNRLVLDTKTGTAYCTAYEDINIDSLFSWQLPSGILVRYCDIIMKKVHPWLIKLIDLDNESTKKHYSKKIDDFIMKISKEENSCAEIVHSDEFIDKNKELVIELHKKGESLRDITREMYYQGDIQLKIVHGCVDDDVKFFLEDQGVEFD